MPGTGRKVLFVDDNADLASILAKGVGQQGYATTWTTDPYEAIRLVDEVRYDAAIIDLVMPRMNGLELAAALMRLDHGIRCVLLTGHGSLERCKAACRVGITAFLEKPILASTLARTLGGILANPPKALARAALSKALGRNVRRRNSPPARRAVRPAPRPEA